MKPSHRKQYGGYKNLDSMQSFAKRRTMRVAQWGRDMEARIVEILTRMKAREVILWFVYHEPNSAEDSQGMDFTVTKLVERTDVARSFGVTISAESQWRASMKHRDTPQWWLPINTRDDTIERKVLLLFE